jgi:hypothetical protein
MTELIAAHDNQPNLPDELRQNCYYDLKCQNGGIRSESSPEDFKDSINSRACNFFHLIQPHQNFRHCPI